MTVSFETAKALKEAGLPCPSPLVYGQMYYSPTGVLLSVVINTHLGRGIFAPTATDLLPVGWLLLRYAEDWVAISAANLINSVGQEYIEPYFRHPNPHEAAAQARLFVNRKNDQK